MIPTKGSRLQNTKLYTVFFVFLFVIVTKSFSQQEHISYSVPEAPWEEELGNHRSMASVDDSAPVYGRKLF